MNHRRLLTVCTLFVVTVSLIGGVLYPGDAKAQPFSRKVAGTYLVIDEPTFLPDIHRQRLVTLTEDGNFSTTVQKPDFFNFDDDRGTWEKVSRNKITAVSISFAYDGITGEPTSVFRDIYTLTFGDKENGKFQTVTGGNVSGERFALGQNPLTPTEDPLDSFSVDFMGGQRIK